VWEAYKDLDSKHSPWEENPPRLSLDTYSSSL